MVHIRDYGALRHALGERLKKLDDAYLSRIYDKNAVEAMFKEVYEIEQQIAALRRSLEEVKNG